ncbi:MAG TPA: DnaA N-terminal domain-containing protein, partial [Allosphingosinicella sp.]
MSQTPAENVLLPEQVDEPIAAAWEVIRANLRRDCGARTFDGWLRPIALGSYDSVSGTIRLELPSQFMADWVQTHFSERLALAWRTMLPDVQNVRVVVGGAAAPRTAAVVQIPGLADIEEPSAARDGGLYSVALEPRYRFENFVVGKANEVAFNAARTLSAADTVVFNPLFIHGGTGRG